MFLSFLCQSFSRDSSYIHDNVCRAVSKSVSKSLVICNECGDVLGNIINMIDEVDNVKDNIDDVVS